MQNSRWALITTPKLIGFLIGMGVFLALVLCCEPGFVFLIDHANLLFHEAGHPVVGIFSRRLEPYGGTLGQLAFPVVLMIQFWRKGQPLSFAGSAIWFFENGLNIARYMADARTMLLPLVGGGIHDWNTILGRWDLLAHDVTISALIKIDAWIGMLAVVLWVGWRYWQGRELHRIQVAHAEPVAAD